MPPQGDMRYNRTNMMLFMLIVIIALGVLIIMVSAVRPKQTSTSQYELQRRRQLGDKEAIAALHREHLLLDVRSLQRIIESLMLVGMTTLFVASFDWIVGLLCALLFALFYGSIARLKIVQKYARSFYTHYEPVILRLIEKHARIMRFIRLPGLVQSRAPQVESREELQHLIATSRNVISSEEKDLLLHALAFESLLVSEVMTPAEKMSTIVKKELLGPLVLDDLHKTGHTHFPVIDKDIHHIIGILRAEDMLTLDIKRSVAAEKAMDAHVYYICDDQTLQQALASFLHTHQHLLIVVNENHETVGLLSLQDTVEALFGRKIIDEFDTHNDIHAVAKRKKR